MTRSYPDNYYIYHVLIVLLDPIICKLVKTVMVVIFANCYRRAGLIRTSPAVTKLFKSQRGHNVGTLVCF